MVWEIVIGIVIALLVVSFFAEILGLTIWLVALIIAIAIVAAIFFGAHAIIEEAVGTKIGLLEFLGIAAVFVVSTAFLVRLFRYIRNLGGVLNASRYWLVSLIPVLTKQQRFLKAKTIQEIINRSEEIKRDREFAKAQQTKEIEAASRTKIAEITDKAERVLQDRLEFYLQHGHYKIVKENDVRVHIDSNLDDRVALMVNDTPRFGPFTPQFSVYEGVFNKVDDGLGYRAAAKTVLRLVRKYAAAHSIDQLEQ